MPAPLSQQLLSVLQLTRMALVFTAISNSLCAMLLLSHFQTSEVAHIGSRYSSHIHPAQIVSVIIISIGLYGFGMSLNDIIDRRRDQQMASHRPLPSGRIGVVAANSICTLLLASSLAAGAYYAFVATDTHWASFLLLLWTASLIAFYDYAGKYLVALGLGTLGLIRFFHSVIPAPQLPLVWQPLLLLNHVTILSAICYQLEAKRPPLTNVHWYSVIGGLLAADAACILAVWWKLNRRFDLESFQYSLRIEPGLAYPAIAVAIFIGLAWMIRHRQIDPRAAGQQLMLVGLLWLIVYDAAFVLGYVAWLPACLLLLLLPAAYLSVHLMRWWSRVLSLSQKPTFQRAR